MTNTKEREEIISHILALLQDCDSTPHQDVSVSKKISDFILERDKKLKDKYFLEWECREFEVLRDERKKVAEEIHDRMLTLKGSSVGVLEVCDICEEVISSCEVQE